MLRFVRVIAWVGFMQIQGVCVRARVHVVGVKRKACLMGV